MSVTGWSSLNQEGGGFFGTGMMVAALRHVRDTSLDQGGVLDVCEDIGEVLSAVSQSMTRNVARTVNINL